MQKLSCVICLAAASLAVHEAPRFEAAPRPATPTLEYTLAFVPGGEVAPPWGQRPSWELSMRGEGFDPDGGAICLVLNSWGDWMEIDSLYLDLTHTKPAVDAAMFPGNAVVLELPQDWDGSFEADFTLFPLLAGSTVNQRYGMLPRWSPSYSFGQTRNVFPAVYQDAGKVEAQTQVSVTAPRGVAISTGWQGITRKAQRLQLDPSEGNGFLAFGEPRAFERRALQGGELQVLQYGQAQVVAPQVADLVQQLAASMAAALVPHSDPMVVYISDVGGGGMGTDFGLVLGYEASTPDWQIASPYYHHFVAHELFHHWLGSKLDGGESFTWFHEGFTEYFGLWHLAATQSISQDWFWERLRELGQEAIENSAWGEVPFAGEAVQWRDGDGPRETMAYKGGAMLAFLMDVRLRELGQSGAQQMLRDFLLEQRGAVSVDDLESWWRAHELGELWEEFVSDTCVPDLDEWIERGQAVDSFFEFQPKPVVADKR